MRFLLFSLGLAGVLAAQDSTRQTYTFDVNGRRVASGTTDSSRGGSSSTTVGLNGKAVPAETVQEKVISESPSGRVVERTIQRYDPTGRPVPAERVLIEEQKDSSGGSTVSTTVYDPDINGRYAVRERTVAVTTKSGETLQTQTTVQRPSLSGSLDTVERREGVQTGTESNNVQDVMVYRKNANGGFVPEERITTQTTVENGQATKSVATYDTSGTGKLELLGQRVSRVSKNSDGTESEVVDVYGTAAPGRVAPRSATPRLREQQVIDRKPGNGTLVETVSVRRADLQTGSLGPARVVSETVCTGKCQ